MASLVFYKIFHIIVSFLMAVIRGDNHCYVACQFNFHLLDWIALNKSSIVSVALAINIVALFH